MSYEVGIWPREQLSVKGQDVAAEYQLLISGRAEARSSEAMDLLVSLLPNTVRILKVRKLAQYKAPRMSDVVIAEVVGGFVSLSVRWDRIGALGPGIWDAFDTANHSATDSIVMYSPFGEMIVSHGSSEPDWLQIQTTALEESRRAFANGHSD